MNCQQVLTTGRNYENATGPVSTNVDGVITYISFSELLMYINIDTINFNYVIVKSKVGSYRTEQMWKKNRKKYGKKEKDFLLINGLEIGNREEFASLKIE